MCNEACPQKTDILDKYINAYFYCQMKLVDIACVLNVSPDAVEKGLKRFDMEAYRKERELRKSQNKIKRKENDRVRKQKEREKEPSYHLIAKRILKDKNYHLVVRRLLKNKDIQQCLRTALEKYKKKYKIDVIFDKNLAEQVMCIRYIPCFQEIFHPIPLIASPAVELITPKRVANIVNFEIKMLKSDLVGVPGPAILDIPDYLSRADTKSALRCAELAILDAGYVSNDASITDVKKGRVKIISPAELMKLKDTYLEESMPMAKIPDSPALYDLSYEQKLKKTKSWLAQNSAIKRKSSCWNKGGTGKKGKGGGKISIENRTKMTALNRY